MWYLILLFFDFLNHGGDVETVSEFATTQNAFCHSSSDVVFVDLTENGLGSNFHRWATYLTEAHAQNKILIAYPSNWIWNQCKQSPEDPLRCFFNVHPNCDLNSKSVDNLNFLHYSGEYERPEEMFLGMSYLFSTIRQDLKDEALSSLQKFPETFITVHLRRSDKVGNEMRLVSNSEYIEAIESFGLTNVNIFLITEDPKAFEEFQKLCEQKNWKLFSYRPSEDCARGRSYGWVDKTCDGLLSRQSIIGVLISLYAKYYVLTFASNWSRLIDELRRGDFQWGRSTWDQTEMIDLESSCLDEK